MAQASAGVDEALWARIAAFSFDPPRVAYPFVQRLADENGWSPGFAEGAVQEYRRFVFLAVTGGRSVTPSREVDAVWHLHLTYTRNYWDRFCGQVLGRPLHHEPTPGGREAAAGYRRAYAETKALYVRVFGETPPEDFWPPEDERFHTDIRVMRGRSAEAPNPDRLSRTVWPRAWPALAAAAGLASVAGPAIAASDVNSDYVTVAVIAFAAIIVALAVSFLARIGKSSKKSQASGCSSVYIGGESGGGRGSKGDGGESGGETGGDGGGDGGGGCGGGCGS